MFCSNCGFQINQNEKFCGHCGECLNNNQQNIQTSNINNATYRLTLTRPKNFVASLVKFKIYIDNIEVGTIKNGETVVLNVTSGNHVISFNKTMNQNLNISADIYADVVVISSLTSTKFGLSNIRDNNGINVQNNKISTENIDKIIKAAKGPLIFSCACILVTFILLFTVEMVISTWVYGISIGYTIINLSSIKKYKQILNDKYNSLRTLNIISIIISVIGIIISGFLLIG